MESKGATWGQPANPSSGLVARSGADFEHLVRCFDVRELCHERHDVGLTDCLSLADRQGAVLIGEGSIGLWHQLVSGDRAERFEDPFIVDAFVLQSLDQVRSLLSAFIGVTFVLR
jgi:hypothetical protein